MIRRLAKKGPCLKITRLSWFLSKGFFVQERSSMTEQMQLKNSEARRLIAHQVFGLVQQYPDQFEVDGNTDRVVARSELLGLEAPVELSVAVALSYVHTIKLRRTDILFDDEASMYRLDCVPLSTESSIRETILEGFAVGILGMDEHVVLVDQFAETVYSAVEVAALLSQVSGCKLPTHSFGDFRHRTTLARVGG